MTWLVALALVGAPTTLAAGRDESALDDREPLPRYLTRPEITTALEAAVGGAARCFQGEAGEQVVRFSLAITSAGVADAVTTDGDPAGAVVTECVASALAKTSFAPHDEAPVAVSGLIVARDGVLLPLFGLQVGERRVDVLFLYLPPNLDPALRLQAAIELGYGAFDGTPLPDGG